MTQVFLLALLPGEMCTPPVYPENDKFSRVRDSQK